MSAEAITRIEFAHGILISNHSFACGKTLNSLALDARNVYIIALHRNNTEIEYPTLNTFLQNQDTLVVRGKPINVERVEHYLQEGK